MSAEKRGETDGPFVRISLTFLVSAVNRSSRVLPALGSSVHIPFTLGPSLQSGPDPKGRRTEVVSNRPTVVRLVSSFRHSSLHIISNRFNIYYL